MAGSMRNPGDAPSASELVFLARRRLASELEHLPAWKSPAFWVCARSRDPARAMSLGALAHCLRRAALAEDALVVRELFTLLIERVEAQNLRWARRTVGSTPTLRGDAASAACEDLMQEIALYLWEQLRRGGEQWELFFARALDFARRHVASAYMEKRGLWQRAGVTRPVRSPAHLVESLSALTGDDGAEHAADPPDGSNALAAADLADLRLLVLQLPLKQRIAVVLRFWQGASEEEIARALGGVTTRTVRNHLRAAYARLRIAYEGAEVKM